MALTAAQIVASVCQMCKAPGFTVQCGQFLNQVLDELQQHYDVKQNRVVASIVLTPGSSGPYPLESDYLRTYDLFYYIGGSPAFLKDASQKQVDEEYIAKTYSGYPYEWTSDLSAESTGGTGLLFVYPPPSGATTLTHRYMQRHADIAGPESSALVPWFLDQSYLLKRTAAWLMTITDDERQQSFEQQAMDDLQKHLIMDGDEQKVVKRVELDWRTFRKSGGSRSTKKVPY